MNKNENVENITCKTNIVAYFFKCFAVVGLVVDIILFFSINKIYKFEFIYVLLCIIGIIILFVVNYSIGEIIQIIHDIRRITYENKEINRLNKKDV